MVALPGPPLVMIQNRSKAMIELIEVSNMISSNMGRSHGSVILKNRSTAPAPSMRAARCRFSGMDCSAARTSSAVRGA